MSTLLAFDPMGRGIDMTNTQTGGGFFYNSTESPAYTYLGAIDYDTIVFEVTGDPIIKYFIISATFNFATGISNVSELIYMDKDANLIMSWTNIGLYLNIYDNFSNGVFYSILNTADTISGNNYADIIKSGGGNDTIYGGGGNDTLFGESGNDFLDGQSGEDTASYSSYSRHFSTKLGTGTFYVTGNSSSYGSDRLTSIEKVSFSDLTLETSWFSKTDALTSAQSDSLVELYIASFNRAPDAIGLNYWGGRLYDGMSLAEIARSFFVQPETVAAYPSSMSNQTFVTTVYNNVLSRAPDTEGLNYWAREIDTGSISRDVFLLAIINGAKASSGSATDRQTLANKGSVGNHFAFDEGLNNATWGIDVMDSVTHLASTVTAANALTDRYSDAIATGASSLGMPMSLMGVDVSEPSYNLL